MKIRVPVKRLDVQMKVVTLDELERSYILEVLKATGWRIKGDGGAAELLGLHPSTLHSRMRRLGIKRPW